MKKKPKIMNKEKINIIFNEARKNDSLLVYYFYRRVSFFIASKIIIFTSITPNQITLFSFSLAVITSFFIGIGKYPYLISGGVLLHLVYIFDCLDGDTARLKNLRSKFGEWLDHNTDIWKIVLLYSSIAIGYYRQSGKNEAFILLSLLLATRFILNIAVADLDRIFSDETNNIVIPKNIYKFGKLIGIRPQFLTFSDDFKYLIISLGLILNRLRGIMELFIIIHFLLFFFLVLRVSKKRSYGL